MDDFRSSATTPISPTYKPPSPPVYAPPSPPGGKSLSKKIVVSGGFVLVLVLVLWLLMSSSGNTLLSDPFVTNAPKGEAVKNFPAALIPEGNPYIEDSYSIAYKDAGKDFPVVTFTSTKAYEPTIDEFRRMLLADGWTVMRDGTVDESPTSFYAVKDGAEVNITIEEKEAGPWVTIAYSEPR